MNIPNNKRKRESIEKIENVFLDLLQTKELNEIHVSDICKRAELNRTTFYANYTDIYDLADSMRNKLESALTDMYQEEIKTNHNRDHYLKLFHHIKANQNFYQTYFKLGYHDQYKMIVHDTELAAKHFQNRFLAYHTAFFKGGLTKIIQMWLQNGCQETPEEMFEMIQSEYRGRDIYFSQNTDD